MGLKAVPVSTINDYSSKFNTTLQISSSVFPHCTITAGGQLQYPTVLQPPLSCTTDTFLDSLF